MLLNIRSRDREPCLRLCRRKHAQRDAIKRSRVGKERMHKTKQITPARAQNVVPSPAICGLAAVVGPRCLGQRGPCKAAPFRRRLLLIDARAFSQRNSCPIGQFYKPSNELPANFDDVLRSHRQPPWKLKRCSPDFPQSQIKPRIFAGGGLS